MLGHDNKQHIYSLHNGICTVTVFTRIMYVLTVFLELLVVLRV